MKDYADKSYLRRDYLPASLALALCVMLVLILAQASHVDYLLEESIRKDREIAVLKKLAKVKEPAYPALSQLCRGT